MSSVSDLEIKIGRVMARWSHPLPGDSPDPRAHAENMLINIALILADARRERAEQLAAEASGWMPAIGCQDCSSVMVFVGTSDSGGKAHWVCSGCGCSTEQGLL